jgi:predicted AAA+ superfamily ATPase
MPETQTTNPPTFESVMAALQETARRQEEDREHLKETERIMKEDSQRYKKEFNERLGALTNLFGDLTEAMVAPKICEKFEEIGLFFPRASRNIEFNDRVNNISFEVDIMLENGEKAMLIEVKTKLTDERIDKHILRLEEMRKYADLHGDKRIFLGAVAGIVVTDKIKKYALSKGLYFIEYAGETFYITPPKDEPKEW